MVKYGAVQQIFLLAIICAIIGAVGGIRELITGENKKKREEIEKAKQEAENKKTRDITSQEMSKLVTKVKSVYKSLLTAEYKKKIRQAIDELWDNGDLDPKYDKEYYNNNKIPTPVFRNEDYCIVVYEEEQLIKAYLSFVLKDIAKEVKKDPEFKQYKLETGDGDEGCIYPLIYINPQN